MADNYLERKMEEYRSGSLGRRTVRSVSSTVLPKGKIAVDFPQRTVIVVGECDVISRGIVSRFVSAGCKTAFCSVDRKAGATLAQSFGARFYPVRNIDRESFVEMVDDVTSHWGRPDTLIVNSDNRSDGLTKILDDKTIAGFYDAEGKFRMIEIGSQQSVESDSPDPSDSSDESACMEGLSGCDCRNRIIVGERDEQSGELVGSLCVFLCEPCGRFVAGQTFEI